MSISSLTKAPETLEESSRLGIPIQPELLQMRDNSINREINAFLTASQHEIDSRERDKSIDCLVLLLWRTCYKNIIQKIIGDHEKFPIYHTCMIHKEHAKEVIRDDFREKIQAIHEMLLKSWPHMVPPLFEHIHLPAGHLKNKMLWASWDDGIDPRCGFVEPPSLKPNTEPCSIEDYFKSDYLEDHSVRDNIAFLAEYLSGNGSYNPIEQDPTFLSDFMERHGRQKGYNDVSKMFPNFHLPDEYLY